MPSDDDLNRICDAFGAVLAPALPEWNVLSFQPDAVTTPALFPLMPDLIEYDITYGRGADRYMIPILALVSRTSDEGGQRMLRALVAGNGVLKKALQAFAGDTACPWQTSRIVMCDKAGPTELAPGETYFGSQLTWEVII